MISAEIALTVIGGILSGVVASYIFRFGDDISAFFERLGCPKKYLGVVHALAALLAMFIYIWVIVLFID